MVELSVEPKRKQQREHLLARMTGRRINTDNVVVVVVAVTFLFSAVAETGAGAGVQACGKDDGNDFLPSPY